MEFMAFISGKARKLAAAEIKSVFSIFSPAFTEKEIKNQVMVFESDKSDSDNIKNIKNRLSLTHSVFEFIGKCELTGLEKFLENMDYEVKMPFCARVHFPGIDDSKKDVEKLEKHYAEFIWDNALSKGTKPSVDLSNPESGIEIFIEGKNAYMGKKLFDIDKKDLYRTEPENRPFRRPITMNTNSARLMVNLARVKKGRILDPLCGTGAILIEAARMGLSAYGVEIKEDLAEGAKENLSHFGLNADIRIGDSRDLERIFGKEAFDAIVTDLPYGISAHMANTEREKLYSSLIPSFEKALKPGSYCILAAPGKINIRTYLELRGIYKERMSTNLVRHIHVYRKSL